MIYIDTRDQLSLKHGVMEFLNVTEEELELVFETIDSVDEDPYDWVKKYLEDYGIDSPLEYIQMFHLTRRLNGTDLRTNNNLERLLLCKTPLSDFRASLDPMPNPTNEVVAPYYGVGPLWKTEYSQGIVVRAEDDDDYYIVMECSSKNKGYKHTKVILTMGGCM